MTHPQEGDRVIMLSGTPLYDGRLATVVLEPADDDQFIVLPDNLFVSDRYSFYTIAVHRDDLMLTERPPTNLVRHIPPDFREHIELLTYKGIDAIIERSDQGATVLYRLHIEPTASFYATYGEFLPRLRKAAELDEPNTSTVMEIMNK